MVIKKVNLKLKFDNLYLTFLFYEYNNILNKEEKYG